MASMNEKDYYAILEVDEKATTEEIRKAFQKKARKLHPDVNKEPDAEERFKEVSEAYAVLSDDEKRKRYDSMRAGVPFGGGYGGYTGGGASPFSGSPFEGFPFDGAWTTGQARQTRARAYSPRAGNDVVVVLEVDAEQAAQGFSRGITYERFVKCDVCHGFGSVQHSEPVTCPTCGGAGRMRIDLGGLGLFGVGFFEVTCPECEGAGKVVEDPCDSCGGSGRVYTASEIVVEIPAGSHDGDEVRKEGQGNAGTNGRESGDFVCRLGVEEERLTTTQTNGFRLVGIGLPIVVLGFVSKSVVVGIMGAAIVAYGIATMARDGVRINARWFLSALKAIGGGALNGIAVVVLLSALLMNPFFFPIAMFVGFMVLPALLSRRS